MNHCKMAFIAPLRYTLQTNKLYSNYHLLLAQEFLTLPQELQQQALAFWKSCKQSGHYLILDNGAYELGKAIDFDMFVHLAVELQPNEIILPDVLQDGVTTMQQAKFFYNAYASTLRNMALMAVVQVDSSKPINMDEIEKQLHFYSNELPITAIGIPKHFGHDQNFGRVAFTEQLHAFLCNHMGYKTAFAYHYLGLASLAEIAELPKYEWIRGFDSAAAFVFALQEALLEDYIECPVGKQIKRPAKFFDYATLQSGANKCYWSNIRYCCRQLAFANTATRYKDRG